MGCLVPAPAAAFCGMPKRLRSPSSVSTRRPQTGRLPGNLYGYADTLAPRRSARPSVAATPMAVSDDWPEYIPVTEAEIAVFEAWFGDILEELFLGE